MLRRLAAATSAACLIGGVVACSSEEPSSLPTLSESTPTATTPTPSSAPASTAQPSTKAPDSKGHELFRGKIAATTPDQKSAAEVWLGFWQMRLDTLHAAKLDPDAASKFASGKAVDDMVGYIGYLTKNKLHTEGDLMIGVSSVAVSGGTATVLSCVNDWSVDVNAQGVPTSPPARFFQTRGTLTKVAGGWRVSRAAITSRQPCTP